MNNLITVKTVKNLNYAISQACKYDASNKNVVIRYEASSNLMCAMDLALELFNKVQKYNILDQYGKKFTVDRVEKLIKLILTEPNKISSSNQLYYVVNDRKTLIEKAETILSEEELEDIDPKTIAVRYTFEQCDLTTAVRVALKMMDYIKEGYTFTINSGNVIDDVMLQSMLNYVLSSGSGTNKHRDDGIIMLDETNAIQRADCISKDKYYMSYNTLEYEGFTNMGVIMAQLIAIKAAFYECVNYLPFRTKYIDGKPEIIHYSEGFDEYYSAGAVEIEEFKELSKTNCLLDSPLTILTTNKDLFENYYTCYNSASSQEIEYHDSIAKSFKAFKFIYVDPETNKRYVYVKGKLIEQTEGFIALNTDELYGFNTELGELAETPLINYLKLFGHKVYDGDSYMELWYTLLHVYLKNIREFIDFESNSIESLMEIELPVQVKEILLDEIRQGLESGRFALNLDNVNLYSYIDMLGLSEEEIQNYGVYFEGYEEYKRNSVVEDEEVYEEVIFAEEEYELEIDEEECEDDIEEEIMESMEFVK